LIYNAIILRNDDSPPIEPKNENSFFTLGSVGRLSEQKGYSDLISALALAGESIPNLRLILIGDGELRESLESKAMSLGIEDKVFFVGKVNNVSDYLRQMDLFISSSLWEGLPTVIMEAMLAGVPVVGTSIPGTTDLITAGVNGWLAPSGNPELLSQEIVKAVQDPVQQQKFKDAARKSVEEFSLERIAEKYELLYKEILSTKQH
jgi:glycosyltransferase involved in cell wall biosynthesis